MLPYTSCEKYRRSYIVLNETSKRCSEYVRRSVKCNVKGISFSNLESLQREEARLQFERDAAFTAAIEGLARVQQLEKQQALVKRRGAELVRRKLRDLDELDEAEEREKEEKEMETCREAESRQLAATTGGPSGDFSFDLGPLPGPDDPIWATFDFGSRTPQISSSS
ncbi:uncharacterized protein BP5553_08945 [Venustampulla echinocandica]|uniref:Uncharacterized protein n=1 Tax=Venustampulla echinocandica TaxID=2656787 RepID=A0A370TDE6_9HELO|nr:uncharacterized protein BP5553_08945 [Venustampulla echinocandica]RDL32489.1 hypothetical protein BP5553_08945 [Venustampulla echinocandica]